jgi:hypothetical protein
MMAPDPAIKRTISPDFDFGRCHGLAEPGSARDGQGNVSRRLHPRRRRALRLDTDETMLVDLTFYRPETDGFVISYDQAVKPVAKQVRFKTKAGEGIWHTETVPLEE